MNKNLPNQLTMLRMILVPVMVLFFYLPQPVFRYLVPLVFIIASVTDFFDGYLARKHNIVSDFGKFMDPLADKALVLVAIILILDSKMIPFPYVGAVVLIIMLMRELIVSGVRLLGANKGVVISADKLGKVKTVTQMIAIILLLSVPAYYEYLMSKMYQGLQLTDFAITSFTYVLYGGVAVLVLATIISIISGVQYIVKNRELFNSCETVTLADIAELVLTEDDTTLQTVVEEVAIEEVSEVSEEQIQEVEENLDESKEV